MNSAIKNALFAIGTLVCLFIGLYAALMIFAAMGSRVFDDIAPNPTKMLVLGVSSVVFLSLAVFCFYKTVQGLRRP